MSLTDAESRCSTQGKGEVLSELDLNGLALAHRKWPSRKRTGLADPETVCHMSECASMHARLHLEVLCHS